MIYLLSKNQRKIFKYSIINAPTEERDDAGKETFYSLLENSYDTWPGNDVKMVFGCMNAQVGRENVYVPTIGMHSIYKNSCGNGVRLIDFATSKRMGIGSALFPRCV